ncbi:MAG: protein phosphatase CheZ, partial [Fimbriimonadaceae bacterium]|nr:protein phosphatase CheZ [Alphaproteobacteria bacterium]
PLRSGDYDAIRDAVMETERGRWFLREFAQRNRNADTEILLSAIQKLHNNLIGEQRAPDAQRITLDLADMANAIAETKKQISAMGSENGDQDKVTIASNELDAIVRTAEKATGDILNTAEQVQEIAWNLREMGVDAESCDSLDKYATDIYTACSFQDLTGQRTEKVIKVLQFIENRVLAMIDIWQMDLEEEEHHIEAFDGLDNRPDAHLLNGPQLDDIAASQGDIDDMMSDDMFNSPATGEKPEDEDSGHSYAPESGMSEDEVSDFEDPKFDVSEPEIIDCVAYGCDTPYDPDCVAGNCRFVNVADSPARAENLPAMPKSGLGSPIDLTGCEIEQVEIGTSDEFAGLSSDPESGDADDEDRNFEQMRTDHAGAAEPDPELPSHRMSPDADEVLSAPLITTGEPTQPETAPAPLENTVIGDDQNEPETGLSALSTQQRQAIFS